MIRSLFSPAVAAGLVALVLAGAIFGFFYAWVCSTMWGLDAADPRVAIAAMQEMNASVRNPVFFPAFFLTPLAMAVAAVLAHRQHSRAAATAFAAAAVVYLFGGLLLTLLVNVPMNQDLAEVAVPATVPRARLVWEDYSGRWQTFNQLRTAASGISLLLAAVGLRLLAPVDPRRTAPPEVGRP
jgi:uncharacterized membrane protein